MCYLIAKVESPRWLMVSNSMYRYSDIITMIDWEDYQTVSLSLSPRK
jgi:hypothetical protein